MQHFGRLAMKLHDMGWRSLIPIKPGEKAPAMYGWERYNTTPPAEDIIQSWASLYASCGIGLAFGPDRVIGMDLDFMDPVKATRADSILKATLGTTSMVRVGQSPKQLAFYRAEKPIALDGRAFGGFEIYQHSGQCLLYGLHPKTGRDYYWPEESPETLSPSDLPVITTAQVQAFITEMAPLRDDVVRPLGRATVHNAGRTTTWLQEFATLAAHEDMIALGAEGIRGVGHGARHYTMQAVVTALVTRSISPDDFLEEISAAYAETLDAKERQQRRRAVSDAASWAIRKIWGGITPTEIVELDIAW
jgi:hypothetical protein